MSVFTYLIFSALSFPLTLLWCLQVLSEIDSQHSKPRCTGIRIVAAGCSHRLEQRIIEESNIFHILQDYLPEKQIRVCITGPEVRDKRLGNQVNKDKLTWVRENAQFEWCVKPSTVQAFIKAHPCNAVGINSKLSWQTVVIVYNSGLGSGDKKLRESWANDITFLLDLNVPCFFTCASESLDVLEEMKVMRKHRAKFLMLPRTNPFAAMTVLVPEDTTYRHTTQANVAVYIVQGKQEASVTAVNSHSQGIRQIKLNTCPTNGSCDSSNQEDMLVNNITRRHDTDVQKHTPDEGTCLSTSSESTTYRAAASCESFTQAAPFFCDNIPHPVTLDLRAERVFYIDLRCLSLIHSDLAPLHHLQVTVSEDGYTILISMKNRCVYKLQDAQCDLRRFKLFPQQREHRLKITIPFQQGGR